MFQKMTEQTNIKQLVLAVELSRLGELKLTVISEPNAINVISNWLNEGETE